MVTAVAQVLSPAWELLHAADVAKTKQNKTNKQKNPGALSPKPCSELTNFLVLLLRLTILSGQVRGRLVQRKQGLGRLWKEKVHVRLPALPRALAETRLLPQPQFPRL